MLSEVKQLRINCNCSLVIFCTQHFFLLYTVGITRDYIWTYTKWKKKVCQTWILIEKWKAFKRLLVKKHGTIDLVRIQLANLLQLKSHSIKKMAKYIGFASFMVASAIFLSFLVLMTECGKKSCLKDSDCAHNEQCSVNKCQNACLKNPCAPNTVCKVLYFSIFTLFNQTNHAFSI